MGGKRCRLVLPDTLNPEAQNTNKKMHREQFEPPPRQLRFPDCRQKGAAPRGVSKNNKRCRIARARTRSAHPADMQTHMPSKAMVFIIPVRLFQETAGGSPPTPEHHQERNGVTSGLGPVRGVPWMEVGRPQCSELR